MQKPIHRSPLRLQLGMWYYGAKRKAQWRSMRNTFAKQHTETRLPFVQTSHSTVLLRKLKDVDMWMQHNKIENLRIAVSHLNGICIRPGETFSYWYLIGKPTKTKGYRKGMVLRNGTFHAETGGGLCQLSNLIFWMTMHTPLTIVERHRHGYDVFPDSNRTQPFGSGATCFYPHGDLMIQNNTQATYQLCVTVGETHLEGAWRVSEAPTCTYHVVERNHTMQREYWGGFSRNNELYQQVCDANGALLQENFVLANHAIMMYAPFLNQSTEKETEE